MGVRPKSFAQRSNPGEREPSNMGMGKLHTIAKGYRKGTRNKYAKKYRCKGEPGVSRYLVNFKRGDFVDIVVDGSIHKGMPYSFYHGKTGIVFNVNRNALGVEWQPPAEKAHPCPYRACEEVSVQRV